jgi:glycosyltransferase involved in cell wall biosynthesis
VTSRPTVRHVAFFTPGWPVASYPNGIVTYTENVRHGLRGLGVEASVVAAETDGPVADGVIDMRGLLSRATLGNRLLHALMSRTLPAEGAQLRAVQDLSAAVRQLQARAQLDLFEMEETFGLAESIRRKVKVPIVVRLHGPWFLNGAANGAPRDRAFEQRSAAERQAIARARAVSAPSADVLQRVREEFQLELPRAEVIPNPGVVVPPVQRWQLPACDRRVVLFVGRFDRHKGGDLVIDAFARLAPRHPELRLQLAGPDIGLVDDAGRGYDQRAYLASRLPDAAARARVEILGSKNHAELADLRRNAFVTVVPSRYETFSMTTLEALGFGSPLVAASAGAIPELVTSGHNGLLFHGGDADHLAAQIGELLENPELAARLGAQAASDYAARFTPEVVARATLAFYERVLAEPL